MSGIQSLLQVVGTTSACVLGVWSVGRLVKLYEIGEEEYQNQNQKMHREAFVFTSTKPTRDWWMESFEKRTAYYYANWVLTSCKSPTSTSCKHAHTRWKNYMKEFNL